MSLNPQAVFLRGRSADANTTTDQELLIAEPTLRQELAAIRHCLTFLCRCRAAELDLEFEEPFPC